MRTFPMIGAATFSAVTYAGVAVAQQFSAQPQQPPYQPAQPVQQAPPQAENVAAIVNDDPITKTELDLSLKPHLEANPQLDQQTVQQLQQQVLNSLIDSRLVEQHVIEQGPDVAKEDVLSITEQIKNQIQAQGSSYEQFLAQRGQTKESMAKRIEGSLAWQKYQQQKVTEPQLQQFYQANQQQFGDQPYEQVRGHVVQMYTSSLWKEIAEQARPEAEIQILSPNGERNQPQPGPAALGHPQQ